MAGEENDRTIFENIVPAYCISVSVLETLIQTISILPTLVSINLEIGHCTHLAIYGKWSKYFTKPFPRDTKHFNPISATKSHCEFPLLHLCTK